MAENVITIDDANIAAHLKSKGYLVMPFIKDGSPDDRVAWDVQENQNNSSVSECIQEYYRDAKLQSFISSLKAVRSEMHSIKNIRKAERSNSK